MCNIDYILEGKSIISYWFYFMQNLKKENVILSIFLTTSEVLNTYGKFS
jgi:hypothetical protein